MNPVHCAQVSYYVHVSVTANLHVYGFLLMKKIFCQLFCQLICQFLGKFLAKYKSCAWRLGFIH